MTSSELLPIALLLSSFLPGLVIFALPESKVALRTTLNLFGAVAKLVLVALLLLGVAGGQEYGVRFAVLPGLDLAFKADALGLLFISLSAVLWLFTTLYAIGYLEGAPHRSRFFGFFSLCVTATVGLAMAANLFTFFIFYELLTLATFPLVVHRGTDKAMRGGTIYLAYTLVGGAALLTGIVWLHHLLGHTEFAHAGIAAALGPEYAGQLKLIFVLLIAGVGVKAALVPLHGWLPQAMVAPAPVSALLHAVAVVKAGAFGIVRIVYEVFGVEFAQSLSLLAPLAAFAAVTIVWGSFRALFQDDLKKRLAYSTVSQVSYITLGVALFGPIGTIGGLVHLVHQGIMKITLFFCAGNYAETLGIHKVSEMNGAGRRMPLTTLAFSIGALGMMGAPLTAGAISKAWLSDGATAAGMDWAIWVLWTSSLLNAAYFLPILWRAWFRAAPVAWPEEQILRSGWRETAWLLLLPPLATAIMTIAAGTLAEAPGSPLEWAKLIAEREYRQGVPLP
ncbi:MAG: monovalent cation/H+ antiporter subunit D family protein [Gammaproteobacteria bacterium]|uniref:complex I subunit 5 family protein n=1 Tax=Rhodoferax sp. TaxID=50421 RepID=UPI00179212DF|nr:proton-conducting transporter membrane subunit [Rhodoferax sp.]MBU3898839.1 monovalent cation/H+ antiporter subunit D family protein [Gammaproteobacteria bacterium]MBA3059461.1 monovalent cation/H+ antiporter subunit D family protein [Rhodoferax sp.]MBU3999030.1 monovalent cation/H+ antiporter subunit D family protein [Gammaproteobacteria bacterium]MBU4019315.1 monovalent cation/H+ antiporter subunit D family protein [Gammaproteobacteria bacterium]MBU4081879.1 monovalent cation/H+ antiporte